MPCRTLAATRFAIGISIATIPAAAQEPPPAVAPAPVSAVPPAVGPQAASAPSGPTDDPTAHLRFRHSWLTWDNAVNTQPLGIGRSYQSANPTYTMSGSFLPRYYIYDGGEVDAVYAEGRIDVIHEFTNSDVTTRRGETRLSDTTLATGYARMLALRGDYETMIVVRAPVLTLPTSKVSSDNGVYMGLGGDVRLAQAVPLAGGSAPLFQRLLGRISVGYNHGFTREVTPSNPDLQRVRLTPEGRTVPGNQLTGTAFPEHEGYLRGRLLADITNRIAWWFEASYQPTWKYGFANVDVCVVTGCAPAGRLASPSRFVVVTAFQTELMFELLPELGLDVGYINVETQPGVDGQRRSIFYSPGAQVYLEFVAILDALYVAATGHLDDVPIGHHLRP
jgi:hypothetical protein